MDIITLNRMAFLRIELCGLGMLFALWDADCDPRGRNQHPTRQMRVLFDCHAVVRLPAKWPKKDFHFYPYIQIRVNGSGY